MKILKYIILLIVIITVLFCSENLVAETPIKGNWNFHISEDWSIDFAGDDPIIMVSSITVDDQGNLYFLERKHGKVMAFDKTGKFLFTFGRNGEGPGEFKKPQLLFLVRKHLIICDQGQRIHFYSTKGKFIRTHKLNQGEDPIDFINLTQFVYLYSERRVKHEGEQIKISDLASDKSIIIADVKKGAWIKASGGNGRGSISVRLQDEATTPCMVMALRDNHIYYGMNDKYHIFKIDLAGGNPVSIKMKEGKRKKVPRVYKDELIKKMSPEIPDQIKRQIRAGIPDTCTFFEKIHVTHTGLIYVYLTDVNNKIGHEIDIFSPAGEYLYHSIVNLPEDLIRIRPFVFKGRAMYAFVEDSDGERKLIKFTVTLPTV